MRLIIDAWLERRTPYLQIMDSETREAIARFEGTELQQLFAEGVVSAEELNMDDGPSRRALLQELLLAACCCRVRRLCECRSCCASALCPHIPNSSS